MNRFFKSAALLAAIAAVVWTTVLWHREASRRDMTVGDIALYLAVLPLTLFGLWLGLGWDWRGAVPRREAALAAAATTRTAAAGNALQSLRPWAVRLGARAPDVPGTPPALPPDADARPMVRLLLGWPATWTDVEREAAPDATAPRRDATPRAPFDLHRLCWGICR